MPQSIAPFSTFTPSAEEAFFQTVVQAVGDGLLVADLSGKILLCQGCAANFLKNEEMPLPESCPELWQLMEGALANGPLMVAAPLAKQGQGYFLWISCFIPEGAAARVICLFLANRRLNETNSQLRSLQELTWERDAIIDSSSDGLFVCDAQGNVIRMNPASERIHKTSAREIVGRNMRELIEKGFIERSAALEASQGRQRVSLLQKKDGRKLISIAMPVFDQEGELIRVVVSERDVTEIETLQRELEEQEAMMDQFRHRVLEMQQADLASRRVIAKSPSMIRAFHQGMKVSSAESSVLILGESGVGKGLIADMIHKNSPRAEKPLINLNCGAIPESLIESELFGYEKGAFTGAQGSKPGHLEMADGGTLFLDEVAELPLASQVKLLRFLEDGLVTRLGGTRGRTVNVRILAATHRNIEEMVEQGRFRLDLYYRLNVIPIYVPALRERRDCIVPLIRHYIDHFGAKSGICKRLTRAALDVLLDYPYPGNVRELMNICERLVVMSETELIDVKDLPQTMVRRAVEGTDHLDWPEGMTLPQIVESVERAVLVKAVKTYSSQSRIAEALGISQPTIARRMRRYGLGEPETVP